MNNSADSNQHVLLGRQPVFDAGRAIHGFELFYRCPLTLHGGAVSTEAATARVVLNAVVEIGIDNISSGELLFINCSREALLTCPLIPPERAVLEVTGLVTLDDELIQRLRELRQTGYRIALDQFEFSETSKAALAEADFVKLDMRHLGAARLAETIAKLQRYPVRMIATKIESETELQHCRRLGIELFQGYFLRKPDVVHRKTIPASRLTAFQLVAECQKPNITLQQVAAIISGDVALAWGLLRLANTLLYSGSAPVETLTQAVARLGTQKVMRWALLLTVAGQENCPTGYLQLSLQRAFMCEQIARITGTVVPDAAFLVGLLSLLDSIVDVPMSVLVRQLPVSAAVRAALLDLEGPKGTILKAVAAWDRADWDTFETTGINSEMARMAWLSSLERSAAILRSILETRNSEPVTT